ncbi:MinD/ParA family ATP-binding protein [Nocardiopsis ganjiahuensis]|uniref:MinD/ParA family ATP-binding protein n=1 Tax=Nocardiopsis ganjiahuensis TaxID=239984 RepID=UPI0003487D9C|nr:MinD/ParA family protein [Nocardiopsis ganjiahuensis]
MAQHEQNGSGAEQEPHERTESAWRRTDDSEEFGDPATETTQGPSASVPTPREQWFGGFEGAAPPPPPYARIPQDTPPPLRGTAFRAPAPEEEDEETLGDLAEPALDDSEETVPEEPDEPAEPAEDPEEMRSSTVRLMPGARDRPRNPEPWQEERRPQRPQRPSRPGEEQDPLGPRKLRHDSDVPEPEQLPPLEAERTERLAPAPGSPPPDASPSSFSSPWTEPAQGSRWQPGVTQNSEAAEPTGTEAADRQDPGAPDPWDEPGNGAAPVGRTEPLPDRPSPPPSLTGPRATGAEPPPWGGSGASGGSGGFGAPGQSRAPRQDADHGETSDSLNAATLVRNRRQGPSGGWRRAVHSASLGLINPGESPKVLRERELVARACTPVASGHHRVAVLSLKGGVGKTTTTVALGATLASLRGDRVLAVDANPDRGTLSDKVRLETAATIRDLLNERHLVSRYADIRGFTSQAPSRLEILASDRDPAVSEAFSDADYREVARIVEHFYSICITDCGTGLLHAAMRGVLGLADQVVLVSSASVDGARSASATLDWLEAHGHGGLVRSAVVVLSMVRSNSKSSVDLNRLEEHFAGRCRAVVRVPWDGHLEEGAEVDLEQLAPTTKDAYLQLAASVGEAFAR